MRGFLAPKLQAHHAKKCPIMSHPVLQPLSACPSATLAAVRGVFTDIDETLSSDGGLTAEAYAASRPSRKPACGDSRNGPAGRLVRSHRPLLAGGRRGGRKWRFLDVAGRQSRRNCAADSSSPRLSGRRAEAPGGRARPGPARRTGPGIASDQPYRVADLAIDFREDVPALPRDAIERIVTIFRPMARTPRSVRSTSMAGSATK